MIDIPAISMSGSKEITVQISLEMTRLVAKLTRPPRTTPIANQSQDHSYYRAKHVTPRRSQRHANSNLARLSRN
jgi:hypothetical protein